jgi:hypothetical protein
MSKTVGSAVGIFFRRTFTSTGALEVCSFKESETLNDPEMALLLVSILPDVAAIAFETSITSRPDWLVAQTHIDRDSRIARMQPYLVEQNLTRKRSHTLCPNTQFTLERIYDEGLATGVQPGKANNRGESDPMIPVRFSKYPTWSLKWKSL